MFVYLKFLVDVKIFPWQKGWAEMIDAALSGGHRTRLDGGLWCESMVLTWGSCPSAGLDEADPWEKSDGKRSTTNDGKKVKASGGIKGNRKSVQDKLGWDVQIWWRRNAFCVPGNLKIPKNLSLEIQVTDSKPLTE